METKEAGENQSGEASGDFFGLYRKSRDLSEKCSRY
jgi:hypothetical protein